MAIPSSIIKPIVPVLHLPDRDDELDTYAAEKADKLNGNPDYPVLGSFPELQQMLEALDLYRAALAAADDGNSVEVDEKNRRRVDLENALMILAVRCSQIANGNVHVYLTSGFELRRPAESAEVPTKPENVSAFDGIIDGSIRLEWNSQEGARVYAVEITETPQTLSSWSSIPVHRGGVTLQSETVITGLGSLKRYWFRVLAMNVSGTSEWSDAVMRVTQ